MDQFAAYERAKIVERTRRGRLRKAREGKVLANLSVDYCFEYNAARDGYVVDEEAMRVVRLIAQRRILRLDQGRSAYTIPLWIRSAARPAAARRRAR